MAPTLYIVIPCYNEEEVLPVTAPLFLNKIDALSRKGKISENSRVLFVDDGSRDGTAEIEAKIQEETKATIRCIPIDSCVCEEEGKCVYSGKPSHRRVVFARAY